MSNNVFKASKECCHPCTNKTTTKGRKKHMLPRHITYIMSKELCILSWVVAKQRKNQIKESQTCHVIIEYSTMWKLKKKIIIFSVSSLSILFSRDFVCFHAASWASVIRAFRRVDLFIITGGKSFIKDFILFPLMYLVELSSYPHVCSLTPFYSNYFFVYPRRII